MIPLHTNIKRKKPQEMWPADPTPDTNQNMTFDPIKDGTPDGQPENIMPLASFGGRGRHRLVFSKGY